MSKLVAALLLFIAGVAQAGVLTIEQVEWTDYVPTYFADPPGDKDLWAPALLPVNWYGSPGSFSSGWYRIRFNADRIGPPKSIYFPKLRVGRIAIYFNQEQIWASIDAHKVGVEFNALRIPIPPGLVRDGENTIHLAVTGGKKWSAGISRLYVGDTATLSQSASLRNLLQDQAIFIISAAFGSIGLLSLWMWFHAGRDPVLFWYGVSGTMLLVAAFLWYFSLWPYWPLRDEWRVGFTFIRYHGYLVPFFVLHLRLAGRRHYLLEGALWIALIYSFISVSAPGWAGAKTWVVSGVAFSLLPALLTIPLLMSRQLRAKPAVMLLVVADFAACLLPLHDWAWRLGFLDFDRPYLVFYAPAFVMLAAMAPISERVRTNIRAREQNRLELERRVAEKTREIESSHEQLRQAQREQALAEERRRIMADMHDGLGARLVAVLSVAQSGKAKHGEISEGIAAALDELRLAVDSVQPVEGDVSVVLGNVRHRMRSVFERAGIRLAWNVAALPRMDNLTPERILAIQRIFLEVFSNAIRHSAARTVSVFTMRVPGAVRIVIEDDGRGFDAAGARAGNGLANLKLRAEQAGGTLSVESTPGKGTRVTLSLPLEVEGTPAPLPNTGQKPADYPVQGMAADAVSS